jgi:hypothetical protein
MQAFASVLSHIALANVLFPLLYTGNYRDTIVRMSAITPGFFLDPDEAPKPIPVIGSSSNISLFSRSFSSSKIRL